MNQESEMLKQVSKWAWKAGETQARLDRARDLLRRSLRNCVRYGGQGEAVSYLSRETMYREVHFCSTCEDILDFLNYLKEQENDS